MNQLLLYNVCLPELLSVGVTVVYKWVVLLCHQLLSVSVTVVYKWAVMLCHKLLPVAVVYKWAQTAACCCGVQMSTSDAM